MKGIMGHRTAFQTILIAAFAVGLSLSQDDQPSYLIACSQYIRPGERLMISAQFVEPLSASVSLTANVKSGATAFASQTYEIAAGTTTKSMLLTIPDDLDATQSYSLGLQSTGAIEISDEKDLTVLSKTKSTFIQTDKGTYKPGDTIQFRVISVDMDLTPVTDPIDIKIVDPQDNTIAQWLDQQPEGGLFVGEKQLSDYVNLGMWKFVVEQGGEEYIKSFTIDEYVLPRFEVTVEVTPSFIVREHDESTVIKVKAMYTYGQPVIGTGIVRIGETQVTSRPQDLEDDGTFSLTVSNICENYCQSLKITAEVTETATGSALSGSTSPMITSNKYKLEFLDRTPSSFKAGFSLTAYAKFTLADGSPPDVPPGTIDVSLSYSLDCSYSRDESDNCVRVEQVELIGTPDSAGFLEFEVDLTQTSGDYNNIYLRLEATDPVTQSGLSASKSMDQFRSDSGESCVLTRRIAEGDSSEAPVRANTQVTFDLKTSSPISSFTRMVFSKGELVSNSFTENASPTTMNTFVVDMTVELAKKLSPTARVLAMYLTESGEVLADTLLIQVDGAFSNQVTVAFSAEEVDPSGQVTVTGTAEPGSRVALLAVDQSVLLLSSGNDITQEMVLEELSTYDTEDGSDSCFMPWFDVGMAFRRRRKRSFWGCWSWLSGTDVHSILENNHVLVFTDALVYRHQEDYYQPWEYEDFPVYAMADGEFAGIAEAGEAPPGGDMESTNDVSDDLLPQEIEPPRTDFLETWIFDTLDAGDGTFSTGPLDVPDTITSFVISAFGIHDVAGLGIAQTASLNIFKPFFLHMTLPYSVIRGEKFALKATVYNYLTTTLNIVTLKLKAGDFTTSSNGYDDVLRQIIDIPPNAAKTVTIWVKPAKLGTITLEGSVTSSQGMDSVRKTLIVKPEGQEKVSAQGELVRLEAGETFSQTFTTGIPADVVDGSQRVYVTSVGDILGKSMANLGQLLKMPTGCGEQNMLHFAPDVFIMKYLTATGQESSPFASTAMEYMDRGYQRELTYKRTDHSYSAFGSSDDAGSTWLTAFVVKTYCQAKQYLTTIDDNQITASLAWLISNQNLDGTFENIGRVLHDAMMGGSDGALNAYVTITLLECKDTLPEQANNELDLDGALDKAMNYLESNLQAVRDATSAGDRNKLYSLAIYTYALAKKDSAMKEAAWGYLTEFSSQEGTTYTYWVMEDEAESGTYGTQDIEMTAYALMAKLLIDGEENADSLKIVKWMMSKQNKYGGWKSTQDTVIGLQAISEYVELLYTSSSGGQSLTVEVNDGISSSACSGVFDVITDDNQEVLNTCELDPSASVVTVTVTGSGVAVIQVVAEYNIPVPEPNENIILTIEDTEVYNDGASVDMNACVSWMKQDNSGMSIVKMRPLSGYVFDLAFVECVEVSMTEIVDQDLVLYFNEINDTPTCCKATQKRMFPVSDLQPAMVSAQAYYAPEYLNTVNMVPEALIGLDLEVCGTDDYPCITLGSTKHSALSLTLLITTLLLLAAMIE